MIEIKKKEMYEKLETHELEAIVKELVEKVSIAGDMVEKARLIYEASPMQQEAAYLKSCKRHLIDCRKFRTMLQSILIDRLTAEQTESPYLQKRRIDE
jgi:hypothetical protein